ncbi:hypothetical protein [Streptomyces sp. GSL17-111]
MSQDQAEAARQQQAAEMEAARQRAAADLAASQEAARRLAELAR